MYISGFIHGAGEGEEREVGGIMLGEGSAGCLQISLLEGVSRVQGAMTGGGCLTCSLKVRATCMTRFTRKICRKF